jgi:hypothetical protein
LEHLRFDVMWRGKRYRIPANDFAIPRMEPGSARFSRWSKRETGNADRPDRPRFVAGLSAYCPRELEFWLRGLATTIICSFGAERHKLLVAQGNEMASRVTRT